MWKSDFSPYALGAVPPFAGWDSTSWNVYGGGAVTVAGDATHGKVMRSFGAANQSRNDGYLNQRAEQVPNFRLSEGQTVWLGFDFYVNADLGVSNTWQGPFQMKTGGAADKNYAVGMAVNAHGRAGLFLDSQTESHSLGAAPLGRWTRIVIGMHLSKDPNRAWVEGWRDGINVVARNSWSARNQDGTTGGTMYPGGSNTNYTKFGVYRGPQPFNADFRYANIKLATTYDAAR